MSALFLFWLLGILSSGILAAIFLLARRFWGSSATDPLRQSLESSPISGMLLDPRGNIEYINPTFTRLAGCPAEDLQGKPIAVFKNFISEESAYQALYANLQSGHLTRSEVLLRRPNGEVFWLKISIQPLFARQKIVHFLVIGEDISRQKNLTQTLQRRLDELSLIHEISLTAASHIELQSLVELVGQKLEQAFRVKSVFIALYHPETQNISTPYWTIDSQRVEAEPMAYGEGLTSTVLKNRAPLLIDTDFETLAPQLGAKLTFAKTKGLPKTWLGVPIVYGQEILGVISLQDYEKEKAFSQEDIRLLKTLAANLAANLYNARLFAHAQQEIAARARAEALLRRRAEELATFFEISAALSSNLDLKEVLSNLLNKCRQIIDFDVFYVAIYDPNTQVIYHPLFYDRGEFRNIANRDLHLTPGLSGEVILSRQTLYLPDAKNASTHSQHQIIHADGQSTRSYLGVPIIAHNQVIGVISAQSYLPNQYQPEQIRMLEAIAPLAAIAIENSQLYEAARTEAQKGRLTQEHLEKSNRSLQIEIDRSAALQDKLQQQAIRDPLTGLYNRRHLEEVFAPLLRQSAQKQAPFSLIMLDIDHFKAFNDIYGHPAGDALLNRLGRLLRRKTREADIACRYGGEEFVILLPATDLSTAAQRAEQIRQACAEMRLNFDEKVLKVTISLGVVAFPTHGENPKALISLADQALYAAKQAGRNCVHAWET